MGKKILTLAGKIVLLFICLYLCSLLITAICMKLGVCYENPSAVAFESALAATLGLALILWGRHRKLREKQDS